MARLSPDTEEMLQAAAFQIIRPAEEQGERFRLMVPRQKRWQRRMARALAEEPRRQAAAAWAGSPGVSELTEREGEVARLVAQGLSDKQVGARLSISPRTVDGHLRNIYGKLGISSRAALTAWAMRQGLTD